MLVARHALIGVLASMLLLLQGCGGGTSGDPDDPPPEFETSSLSGRVTDGLPVDSNAILQVRVKGSAGLDRTSVPQPGATGPNYAVALTQLSGPYLLTNASGDLGTLFSVAIVGGTANLTPFTTLLVAELLGTDPAAFFTLAEGKGNGGFSGVTQAQINEADTRMRRYLQIEIGFEIPSGLGNLVTTSFEPEPGDPMFDAIVALNAELAGRGTDYTAFATGLIEEAARCKLESVSITQGAVIDRFCLFAKRNEVDEVDTTINVIGFSNRRDDALTVRTRGNDVLSAQFLTREGASFECSGAGCNGITLGTPAGDLTRPISFAAVTLNGTSGSVTLQGSLQSAVPGIALPGVPCTTNRYFLIDPDRSVEGYCATPDDFGLGAAGRSNPSGSRLVYTFPGTNGDVTGPDVEVVTQGDTVVRVLVRGFDPDTGATTFLFQCRDGCPGAALGPVTVDNSLGIEVALRPIGLDAVVLSAVLPDGTLSATDSVTLEASLTGFVVNDPSVLPFFPVACSPAAPTVVAALSEQAQPVNVCVPDDPQGFPLVGTFLDEFGNTAGFFVQNLLEDGGGGLTSGNIINVLVSGGAVMQVSFDQFNGPRYQCDGMACAGVSASAPNGAGETTLTFSGTVLQEIGTGSIPADRAVTLNGSFVAPPAPPPEGPPSE